MKYPIFAVASLLMFAAETAWAVAEPVAACQDAVNAFDKDPAQALEDARWCVEQLEQLEQDQQAGLFREEVAGYRRGAVEQQKVMGMSSIIATYTKAAESIKVTRLGASDGSNPMAALAGLAQFGGGRKVRIDGNTGTLMDQNGRVVLSLTLREGGSMMFEATGSTMDAVQAFATEWFTEN